MLNTRFYGLCTLLLLTGFQHTFAQEKNWRAYEQAARDAYKSGNTAAFVSNLEQALRLKPHHTRLMYNLAAGYTAEARYDEALGLLEKVAATGMLYPFAKSPAFKQLRDSSAFKARFEAISGRFEASAKPVGTSVEAFHLTEKGLITESVAYDPQERAFYISSIHKRKIVKVSASGIITDFSQPSDNLWSVSGMKVDAKRRKLWVCTNALPQMQGFDTTLAGKAALCVYNLQSGKLMRRFVAPSDGSSHVFGDLTLHPKTGQPLVSDSDSPTIFTTAEKNDTLAIWLKSNTATLPSLQGLDFAPDGKTLFVADYSNGIFKLDAATKILQHLETPDSCVVSGNDGLYYYKGNLLGIQNGTSPHRIVRYRLNMPQSRIESVEILEANNALFDEPTLGVVAGDALYYVANSQWEKVSGKGVLAPEAELKRHIILRCELKNK